MEPLRIGDFAERVGVNPRTLRYYERIGVLPPPERSHGGYRLYSQEDEERLRFVKGAQRLGFTLGEIREVLAFADRRERPCRYVAGLVEQRLSEVDERMRDLRVLKRTLRGLSERMRAEGFDSGKARFCHYIESGIAEAPESR